VPLQLEGAPTAIIALARTRDEPFTVADAGNIQHFGSLAALRLRNVRLLDRSLQAEHSRAEFMNTAVHEMRSPLTVISGYADMALAESFGPLTPGLEKAIGTVALKAEEMKRTVDELLTLARLESGSIVSAGVPVDVGELAREAVVRAQPRARMLGGDVELSTAGDDLTACGDAQLIPRILDNLLNNALAYAGPNITVTVRSDDGVVKVDVSDRGAGIAAGEREQIFEKFRRGSNAAGSRSEGSGLGLYLCRGLAQQMGGRLELAGSGPEGSTFRLTLKVATG
jgi:signal transduction histidine kinase